MHLSGDTTIPINYFYYGALLKMNLLKSLITFTAAMFFAGSVIAQDTPIKEYSSDNRLMMNVMSASVLENGMVLHSWTWNDTAKALDPKYGASAEDSGYDPYGLIAQDVQAMYPDAVIEDENGYLTIDLPVLADQDELIAKMVIEGTADTVGNFSCTKVPYNHQYRDKTCVWNEHYGHEVCTHGPWYTHDVWTHYHYKGILEHYCGKH